MPKAKKSKKSKAKAKKKAPAQGQRLRNVCFTWNNYPDGWETVLQGMPNATYVIVGEEIGEEGTKHLQGYAELSKQTYFSVLKKWCPQMHLESRRGSQTQAIDYCKKDGKCKEMGERKKMGERNDISDLRAMIEAGSSELELFKESDAMFKYHKAASKYRMLKLQEKFSRFHKVEVVVLWNEKSGSGKTRRAWELCKDPYVLPVNEGKWFDNYNGQADLIIDDYEGEMEYRTFLKILDGYPYQVPTKGGHAWKCWSQIVITSNVDPRDWYPAQEDYGPLERRISREEKRYQRPQDLEEVPETSDEEEGGEN